MARVAARQDGRITRSQLLAAGLSDKAIRHRLRAGRLHRVHRGVYSVGLVAGSDRARYRGAVLALGPDAFLGHRSAAGGWRFLPAHEGPVHVVVARRSARSRPGIRVHRTVLLDPRDFTTFDGIPITAPARTLLDLATAVPGGVLERAMAEAMVLRRVNERHLREVLARSSTPPGTAVARSSSVRAGAVIGMPSNVVKSRGSRRTVRCTRMPGRLRALAAGPDLTRSEAERILRRLLRAAGLPQPRTNHPLPQGEVDFYFPGAEVVIEVDGHGPHGTPAAFERDRVKRSELASAGYVVLVFSYRRLVEEPHWVVAQVAKALAQSS